MRISDWSSDVCSSDLRQIFIVHIALSGVLDLRSDLDRAEADLAARAEGEGRCAALALAGELDIGRIADDGAVELAGIDSILRAGAVEQVVLDFRFGDRTKDIKQRFSRRAPRYRPVETIFIFAAKVAEKGRILNRIKSVGQLLF